MTIYARERVSFAWLIDPSIETLEVFRLDGETWRMMKTWRGRAASSGIVSYALRRYPLRIRKRTTTRHATKNTHVMPTLTDKLTSDVP